MTSPRRCARGKGADRAPFLPFLSFAVAAARLHGLDILDGVYNAIDDDAGFVQACQQSVDYGCDGRTLIHPSQIAACNAAFAPDDASVRRAQAIVAAFAAPENAGKGALRVDGAMARATASRRSTSHDRLRNRVRNPGHDLARAPNSREKRYIC